jgi:NitT/TauT family transport system substrate-binding protein
MRNLKPSRRAVLGGGIAAAAMSFARPARVQTLDRLVYNTAWRAQAEAGGVFQGAATGIYRDHGIDLEIRQGGPQVDLNALLLAGRVDLIESNGFAAFNFARDSLPGITIAALFQKDPRILLSHPGVGNDSLEALKGKTIMVATAGRTSYWLWLKAKYGYTDEQVRPYTFNLAPFLADKTLTQQGLLTSEPFELKKIGINPVVHLLADHGFEHYQNTIMTAPKLVAEKPDLVQRFVDATIKGWTSYMTGDARPGDAMIKQMNPDMQDDTMAYARDAMKANGILSSGDARTLGIGAMTSERWQRFYKDMTAAGALPPGIDVAKTHTLAFVNKKVGVL